MSTTGAPVGPLQYRYNSAGELVAIVDNKGREFSAGGVIGSTFRFNDFLTAEQNQDIKGTPTIDLTDVFQALQDAIIALYGAPNTTGYNAQGIKFEFDAGAYLFRYLDVWPGVTLSGANKHETRFCQTVTADRDFLVCLARNGYTKRSRSANVKLENLTLQGNGLMDGDVGFIAEMHGLSTALPSTDPDHTAQKNYNSFTTDDVTIMAFSGDGAVCKQRGRAEMNNTRTQDNGGHGVNIQGPDCLLTHPASGNNGKHSVTTSGASTPRIINPEVWASNNDADGYAAIQIDRCREAFVVGGDVNGPLLIEGAQSDEEDDFYGHWAKCIIQGVDFKFRGSNFTDNDDGTPFPVDGYIKVTGFRNVDVVDCVFTPAYDRTTGEYTYRPTYGVKTTGACQVNLRCSLPPLRRMSDDEIPVEEDYPLWPFGAAGNTIDDIVSNPERACVQVTYPRLEGDAPITHFSRVQFDDGGLLGNSAGDGAGIGEIGEVTSDNILPGDAVALTTATVVNLGSITLTPGRWVISARAIFGGSGASATVIGASVADTNSSFKSQDSRYFSRMSVPFTTLTGDELDTRTIPGYTVDVTADTTYYLNVRTTFSAGTMNAYGRLEAFRRS